MNFAQLNGLTLLNNFFSNRTGKLLPSNTKMTMKEGFTPITI